MSEEDASLRPSVSTERRLPQGVTAGAEVVNLSQRLSGPLAHPSGGDPSGRRLQKTAPRSTPHEHRLDLVRLLAERHPPRQIRRKTFCRYIHTQTSQNIIPTMTAWTVGS